MKRLILFMSVLLLTFSSCENKTIDGAYTVPFELGKNVPIVELYLNGVEANFMVDTGASASVLDMRVASYYDFEYLLVDTDAFYGAGGNVIRSGLVKNAVLSDGNEKFKLRFKAIDMGRAGLKLDIVGILGTDFLDKHNYIIDYKNDIIYKR